MNGEFGSEVRDPTKATLAMAAHLEMK